MLQLSRLASSDPYVVVAIVISAIVLPYLFRIAVLIVAYRVEKRKGDLDGLAQVLRAVRAPRPWRRE